jgi:hypothetical protein
VTSTRSGRNPTVSLTVSTPSTVRRIVSLIDSLPIVQPGSEACPGLIGDAPVVTLAFRARAGAPPLARASQLDYGLDASPCNPMSFSVRGRAMMPLLGGTFLTRVPRLLHVRLR